MPTTRTLPVALGFEPATTSDLIAEMVDSGRWRERGVTHWHLVRDEQPYTVGGRANDARFSTDRVRDLVSRAMPPVAHDPREALGRVPGHTRRRGDDDRAERQPGTALQPDEFRALPDPHG